jgi:hypothetical protein
MRLRSFFVGAFGLALRNGPLLLLFSYEHNKYFVIQVPT